VHKSFEDGRWGGEIRSELEPQPSDIVALEHWCSSGFANTDLDLQLKKHGIHKLIVIGLIAHTCVESTVRFAAELGNEVTVVKDATAGYSDEEMHAARRRQYSKLRQCHCDHKGDRRLDLFSLGCRGSSMS
jgi:nicotinamidase-related amidase